MDHLDTNTTKKKMEKKSEKFPGPNSLCSQGDTTREMSDRRGKRTKKKGGQSRGDSLGAVASSGLNASAQSFVPKKADSFTSPSVSRIDSKIASDSIDNTNQSGKRNSKHFRKSKKKGVADFRSEHLGGEENNNSNSNQKLRAQAKRSNKLSADEAESQDIADDEGEFCLLCANSLSCASMGRCSHPICYVCSLRLRVKAQDKKCPICKESSDIVVAFCSSDPYSLTFETFGLDVTSLDCRLPGIEALPQAQMLFVDAHSYFTKAEKLLSISCPVCHARCRSDDALHMHVKEKHGKQFCHLCFSHRSLFINEMPLMTPAQLKAHMEASIDSKPSKKGRQSRKFSEDVAAGHQLCRFCSTYFYDTQDLYVHMRDDHFSCHLCPARDNHRYYKGLSDLLQHLSSTHFLCSLCLNAQMNSSTGLSEYGTGIVAFRRQSEYTEHMRCAHNVKSTSSGYSSLSSHIQASFQMKSHNSSEGSTPNYLDLHFSSTNPYDIPHSRPSNIAANEENDESRDNSNSQALESTSYPALPRAQASSSSQHQSSAASSTPHPLSLTQKISERRKAEAKKKEEEQRNREREKEAEMRRELRNTAFADALGLGSKTMMQTLKTTGLSNAAATDFDFDQKEAVPLKNSVEEQILSNLAKHPFFSELFRQDNPHGLVNFSSAKKGPSISTTCQTLEYLRKPLYSTELVSWAKNHRVELLKIEKKIHDLLIDESASSIQLKPMKKWSLDSVHILAKYYGLNSQQFFCSNKGHVKDDSPTQYISLIKTPDSFTPPLLLSTAAASYANTSLHSAQQQIELRELVKVRDEMNDQGILKSSLYFLINTKKYGAGTTLGDFICQLKSLTEPPDKPVRKDEHASCIVPDDKIVELECIGNGLIRVSLNTFSAAGRLLDIVTADVEGFPASSYSHAELRELSISKLPEIPLSEKFFISAHFSAEDIRHAKLIDDLSAADEVGNDDEAVNKGDQKCFEEGPVSDVADDWDAVTPEEIEVRRRHLVQKQHDLKALEKQERNVQASATGSSFLGAHVRSDVRLPDLAQVAVFFRERLLQHLEESMSAGDIRAPSPLSDTHLVEQQRSVVKESKSKLSVRKPSKKSGNKEEMTDLECLPDSDMTPEEAANLRVAIEESLKDSPPGHFYHAMEDLFSARRDRPTGVYQPPRGPYRAGVTTELGTDNSAISTDERERKVRQPVAVPQQLKQTITYPVRYTYDRRNHNQQVQNAFSILQNGEIDTYYQSDDEEDDRDRGP